MLRAQPECTSRKSEVRRVLHVVGREEREQPSHLVQAVFLALDREMGDAGLRAVHLRAPELFVRHVFLGDGANDIGAGDVHLAAALLHEDEVRDGRRIHRAAGAGAHYDRDLRDDAGSEYVAREDLAVAFEGDDALLDARAAAVVDADKRRAVLHREVHHLADLLAGYLGEGAAEDCEVLREDVRQAPFDLAEADDDGVAVVLLLI